MIRQKDSSQKLTILQQLKKKSSWIFIYFTDRLDGFFLLNCLLLSIQLLFHSQSAVERGFSANADMVADNQSDQSLMALCMTHDHMRSYEAGSHVMKINKELCQSVKKSRQCYEE